MIKHGYCEKKCINPKSCICEMSSLDKFTVIRGQHIWYPDMEMTIFNLKQTSGIFTFRINKVLKVAKWKQKQLKLKQVLEDD